MRLRHVVTASRDIAQVIDKFRAVTGMNVTFCDPETSGYGAFSAAFTVGSDFFEVMQPTEPEVSSQRFLEKHGGDAGYMLGLQEEDSTVTRKRLKDIGIRVVSEDDNEYKFNTQFHPRDFDGVFLFTESHRHDSDWLNPDGDYYAGGVNWQKKRGNPNVLGISGATVRVADAEAAAARWGKLLEMPVGTNHGQPCVQLTRGEIRFESSTERPPTLSGFDLLVRDPAPILAAARANGLPVTDKSFDISGVTVTLVQQAGTAPSKDQAVKARAKRENASLKDTLLDKAARAASALDSIGVASGDVVAMCLHNDLAVFEVLAAAGFLGAKTVSIDWRKSPAEYIEALRGSGAKAVIIHADLYRKMYDKRPEFGDIAIFAVETPREACAQYGISDEDAALPSFISPWNMWAQQYSPLPVEGLVDEPVW